VFQLIYIHKSPIQMKPRLAAPLILRVHCVSNGFTTESEKMSQNNTIINGVKTALSPIKNQSSLYFNINELSPRNPVDDPTVGRRHIR